MPDLSAIVKAYDIRGVVGDQLDEPTARALGAATARLVAADRTAPSAVVVGRDMRDSSPALAAAFADGVTGQGLDVVDIGLASTDMLYFASGSLDLPGAMFTASHNPARYNGIKLCRAGAVPIGQDSGLTTIRDDAARLLADGITPVAAVGTVRSEDMLAGYAAYLRSLVDLSSLDAGPELVVVVDAGNGMGGHTVPTVFDGLNVRLVPLYFELDGTFPNHEANPLEPANLVDLQKLVVAEGADLGLAFDGDADRCFAVDERGEAVSPSAITGLVAVRELGRARAAGESGAAVIHNLITSRVVPELVAEHGGRPVRTRVGHSFIKQTMAETGAVFGGEHSAHYYFRDFWKADSGMLAALHLLAALGEHRSAQQGGTLSGLMTAYERYAASGEINSTVADQAAKVAEIEAAYGSRPGVELDRLDGLTVSLPDGSWFNLRASNTEPLLRLNVEAPDDAAVRDLVDEVLAVVRA
ncbi:MULTISPECIES: phosphomannomutase/phosphoglucomutase [Pseudonocardia]|uniref:Phosphomannomutase/phosphoglucomutase n=2 Tax=Pseudonocardia TaxID=1847 RepID=A0A1Y2MQP6_PSEAH|nr:MULTISPECIES: phosphomannomutase/phosphoglucomutase [Pseudonocardia]OSY37563.1 Phosphomannomutase/phosphoglucomutase [Pseudonocardia autotrophica]TDN73685.1 phosphomannomutase [Pseudonocardia autotrophica]BBG04429.1 phosphomannomutase/phosphoglucomutase [Pseudonocardia autotrophica]GEC27325.1 phosphomannomutase/phosphoglucomutase [Pseudonocardia saturnea]